MAATLIDLIPVGPADRVISYLPLSHIAEQIVTVLTPAVSGHVIYFEPNIRGLAETIKESGPPPSSPCPGSGRSSTPASARCSSQATGAQEGDRGEGARRRPRRTSTPAAGGSGRAAGSPSSTGCSTGSSTRKAKEKTGFDQTRYMFSAAAPLSPSVTHFFAGLGMQILNLYGQSECTGLCSFNRPARNRIGSVGPALPQVELKIADDGEILTRGPNNLLGYLHDPAATAATLDEEGFLHTGRRRAPRRRGLPVHHRPQEGHHHHRRRGERDPVAHRGRAEEIPDHRRGHPHRRRAALPHRADLARPRSGGGGWASTPPGCGRRCRPSSTR